MKKKFLALILSAAMAVTAVPGTSVFATELDQAASVTAEADFVEDELVGGETSAEIIDDNTVTDIETVEEAVEIVETAEEEPVGEESTEEETELSFSDSVYNYTINDNGDAVITGLAPTDATELVLPDFVTVDDVTYTVTTVAENALNGNATSLIISTSIKEFGVQNLPALEKISVDEGNSIFFAQDNVLYKITETTNRLVLYPAALNAESYIIPENVGEIAAGAFANASKLKTVVICKDVKKIEENAFASFVNPLTVVFNTVAAPEVASKAFYLDKSIGNVFYFTSAEVLAEIQEKASDFVESPFFYDPEGGEKLSDTSGVVAFITDGLSDEIIALLASKNIAIEESAAAAPEELVGASDISDEDAQIEEGYYVISTKLADDHYLHIRNDAMNNTGLVEINNSSQEAIVFKVTSEGDGQYRILSFWSNKRLGVNVSVPESGTNVTQRDIKVYNNQMWYIRKSKSDPDHVVIVNCANPNVVVTSSSNINGGGVTVKTSDGSDNQLWKFNKLDKDPTLNLDEEPLYNIVSDANTNLAISVANNNKSTSIKAQNVGQDRQRYVLKYLGYGNVYTVINFTTEKGLCVTADKKTPGADVVQFGTGNNNAQRWRFIRTTASDGTDAYYIKGVSSNLYVNLAGGKTVAGTNIEINTLNEESTQKWKLVEANITPTIPTGKPVCIVSKGNKSLYLNVKNGSAADNTNINVEGKSGTTAQLWALRHLGDGYYKVCNYASKNVLCVKSGNKANGANIVSRPYKEWNSQIWKIVPAGKDGSVYFINKLTEKYMTIKDAKYSSGTNIEQTTLRNDDSQKFYFTEGNIKAGWQNYGTSKRYYNSDLTFKKNCFVENGNYYLNNSGVPYTGFKKYDGYYYYFKGVNGREKTDSRPYLTKLFGTRKTWNGYTAPNCSYRATIDNASPCLMTIYTKYPGTNSWNLPVFAFLVSPGTTSTPTDYGTRMTRTKYRWKELMGPSYGQYATELLAYTHIAGSSYIDWTNNGEYFHSVACGSANDHNLNPAVYNLLGTRQSHGCVRMCVRYAWWTFTYCEAGMEVVVGENFVRPLNHVPQPRAWNNVDPTDPAYTGNYGYTDTQNWVYWNGYL